LLWPIHAVATVSLHSNSYCKPGESGSICPPGPMILRVLPKESVVASTAFDRRNHKNIFCLNVFVSPRRFLELPPQWNRGVTHKVMLLSVSYLSLLLHFDFLGSFLDRKSYIVLNMHKPKTAVDYKLFQNIFFSLQFVHIAVTFYT